jgi:hypothetical protein
MEITMKVSETDESVRVTVKPGDIYAFLQLDGNAAQLNEWETIALIEALKTSLVLRRLI